MQFRVVARRHWAAARALLVFTVICGIGYPLCIWLTAQLPGLRANAEGSIIRAGGRAVGSSLIGQQFSDAAGGPLPQYFQPRPSAAGAGYDPMASAASNLGPESIVDVPGRPSLLTQVCARSNAVAAAEGLERGAGARPFCTAGGVGAVLSVLGARDAHGRVAHPRRVISINEPCATTVRPFLASYAGVPVECARPGDDYSMGKIVPIRGAAPSRPRIPADAVTASGSGLDPDISPEYAELQIARVARVRRVSPEQVRDLVRANSAGRGLFIFGEPRVRVLALNLELDRRYPLIGG